MKKTVLFIVVIGISSMAKTVQALASESLHAKIQPVVAVQDNNSMSFGSDTATTSKPMGIDSRPIKGWDDPDTRPTGQAPAYPTAPPYMPQPAFTPPADQNGTVDTDTTLSK